jgi:hypothetical protein
MDSGGDFELEHASFPAAQGVSRTLIVPFSFFWNDA